jgi:hypothetical protein
MALSVAGFPPDREPRWRIEFTGEAQRWYRRLSLEDKARMAAAFDRVREHGPAARRPHVGVIKGSRHHNMKELRSTGGNLRALFAFDRNRRAIVLLGGDKTDQWKSWYERMIPRADRLYDQHMRRTGKEGAWGPRRASPGRSSGGKER